MIGETKHLQSSDPIVYHVPDTSIIVYAHIQQQPIEATAIGGTIRQAQHVVQAELASKGDGPLGPMWDPFIADFNFGCWIAIQSSDKPGPSGVEQHLMWGILESTFKGLFNIAYVQGYSQEMDFEVLVGMLGIVGTGHITFGSIGGVPVSTDALVNDTLVADA